MNPQPAQTARTERAHLVSVAQQDAGQRLDRYLTAILNDLSRTVVQQLIAGGSILVNGRKSKAGYLLREGDKVQISSIIPASDTGPASPTPMPLDIVYEDQDLLVVNKPAGMV